MSAYDYDSKPSRDDLDDSAFEFIDAPCPPTTTIATTAITTTTTSSSLPPVPGDAKSMVGGETPAAPILTEEQQGLKNLAETLLSSTEATKEQQEIAGAIFQFVNGRESSIYGVFCACHEYFKTHEMPGWFSRDKVGKIIKQIYKLSQMVYKKELQSVSSASGDEPEILSDVVEFDDGGLLSPLNPQGVIDFFNAPGEDHYLFVRMLSDPTFEANILLGIEQETKHPINHWRSATAIKKDTPIEVSVGCYAWGGIGFFLAQIPQLE